MKRSVEDMAAAVISKMPSMAPPVSDEDAARELLAHCRHSSSKPLTTDEFTFPVPANASTEINKRYLGNMIRDVESHNRREEVSDCWRQHEQIKKAKVMTISAKPMSATDINAEREKWAQLKLQKVMGVDSKPAVHNVSVSRESRSDAQSEVGKKKKKLKKEKKEKKKSKKRNKERNS